MPHKRRMSGLITQQEEEEQRRNRFAGLAAMATRAVVVTGLAVGVGLGVTSAANAAEPVPAASYAMPDSSAVMVQTTDVAHTTLLPSGFCMFGHNSRGGCNGGGVFKGSSGRCLNGAAGGFVDGGVTSPETGWVGPVVGAGVGCADGYFDW